MIHNLTAEAVQGVDHLRRRLHPANVARRRGMKDVHPIWMDVQNGKLYPVFDVLKGTGTDGKYTYPDEATERVRRRQAEEPVDRAQRRRAVRTFGHLHPGGLHDDLDAAARRPDAATSSSRRPSTTSPRVRCRGTCR